MAERSQIISQASGLNASSIEQAALDNEFMALFKSGI